MVEFLDRPPRHPCRPIGAGIEFDLNHFNQFQRPIYIPVTDKRPDEVHRRRTQMIFIIFDYYRQEASREGNKLEERVFMHGRVIVEFSSAGVYAGIQYMRRGRNIGVRKLISPGNIAVFPSSHFSL
ncbi:MAG: hypothetical protein WC299_13170 [Kiritimatiellia bacterium]